VPVAVFPPTTTDGLTPREIKSAGLSVSVADTDQTPDLAVMVAEVWLFTPVVSMLNVAKVAPWGRVTVCGTTALPLFEAKLTLSPPAGAG
jgi:hypothetical protein